MRPYRKDEKFKRGFYLVPQPRTPAVLRPNRKAAGMSYTAGRQSIARPILSGGTRDDVLRLVVFGTLDSLRGLTFRTERTICACCGGKTNRLRLNDRGKLRLRALRRKREERSNVVA
jgi:hypothetical protein